jgi:hypothetical protein
MEWPLAQADQIELTFERRRNEDEDRSVPLSSADERIPVRTIDVVVDTMDFAVGAGKPELGATGRRHSTRRFS